MPPTRRKQIEELLRHRRLSAEDLSHYVHATTELVLEDLEHVRRGLRAPDRWIVHPARCLRCDFSFEGRSRLSTPSRCPKCKGEQVLDPTFEIQGGAGDQ